MLIIYKVLIVEIVFICTCYGTEIYLNPEADCTPPKGCDFFNPSTWINGNVPKRNNADTIFITSQQDPSDVMIVVSNISRIDMKSLVIENATVIITNFSLVLIKEHINITDGQLIVCNSSRVLGSDDPGFKPSETLISETSSITLYDNSTFAFSSIIIYGSFYAFNSSEFLINRGAYVYGVLMSYSSIQIHFLELYLNSPNTNFFMNSVFAWGLYLGTGVTLTASSLYATSPIVLNENATIQVINNESKFAEVSVISGASSVGPNAAIIVQSSTVRINGDLSNITLQVGDSSIFASSLTLKEVIFRNMDGLPSDSVFHVIDPISVTTFKKSLDFNGHIIVYRNARLNIPEASSLSISPGCIINHGEVTILGKVVCSSPTSEYFSNSTTRLVGTLEASKIIFSNSSISPSGNAYLQSPSVIFHKSQLVLTPYNSTLTVLGNINFSNSSILAGLAFQLQPTDFMMQVIGIVNITSVDLIVSAVQPPPESRIYYLLNSSSPIIGRVDTFKPDIASLFVQYPSENQIVMEFVAPSILSSDSSSYVPTWVYISIAVGAAMVLVIVIVMMVVKKGKREQYTS